MFGKKKAVIPEEKRQAIFAKIRPIIAKQVGIEEGAISFATRINRDLGVDFDSLAAIELVMALEDEFKIEIIDADSDKMKTIGDIVMYLAERSG